MGELSRRDFIRASAAGTEATPLAFAPGGAEAGQGAWVERERYASVRGFDDQEEVVVFGSHCVQGVSPHAIGRAPAEWISGVA